MGTRIPPHNLLIRNSNILIQSDSGVEVLSDIKEGGSNFGIDGRY